MRRILATAVLTLAAIAPLGGGAAHATHRAVECYGTVQLGGTSGCYSEFPLAGDQFLSNVGTHANYHTTAARGPLTISWFDAKKKLIARYNCAGIGALDGTPDQTSLTCTQVGEKAVEYSAGIQTLLVTTTNVTCGPARIDCVFHGRLSFGGPGDLF